MGQSINNICHRFELAQAMRLDAAKTTMARFSNMLPKAAEQLDDRAEQMSKRQGIALV